MATIAFIRAYLAAAHQLATRQIARDWHILAERLAGQGITVTAQDAAGWADLGYMPGEAEPEILRGLTAREVRDRELHEARAAGIRRHGRRIA
jgi:hypothetical protein